MTTQIDQMVRFIKQEAQEKANEIGVSAEEVGLIALLWVLMGRSSTPAMLDRQFTMLTVPEA